MTEFSKVYIIGQEKYNTLRQIGSVSYTSGPSFYVHTYDANALYATSGGGNIIRNYNITSTLSWTRGNYDSVGYELYNLGYIFYHDISANWVNKDTVVETIFSTSAALTGNYAPVCRTLEGAIRVFANQSGASAVNISIIREIV